MIIQNGKIVFIGTSEAADTYLTSNNLSGSGACRTIELGGKTILPGDNRTVFIRDLYKLNLI